jgi:hypothetical protein
VSMYRGILRSKLVTKMPIDVVIVVVTTVCKKREREKVMGR